MSHVILFAYPIKLNILKRNRVTKILQKCYVACDFKQSLQFNQENTGQIFRHYKDNVTSMAMQIRNIIHSMICMLYRL